MVLYPSADELRQREQQVAASSSNPSAHHAASQQQATPYLSHNQQDLLLAALNSQAGSTQNVYQSSTDPGRSNRSTSNPSQPTMNGSSLFMSPQNAELENFDGDYTPDLDYLDGDSYDFENADLGGEMIGALPGENGNGEGHEKRKSPDENDGSEEGDSKRQETQEGEKGAKKPGRKPLTNEPTTKRKAQNRAAQRAFRERKEKHLKDLETKVNVMEKTSEADKHENGLLKAQVERLQVELKEYRKRLSLNSGAGGVRSSPPLNAYTGQNRSNSGPTNGSTNNFQFDFPKFGALPGSQIFGNQQPLSNGANNGVVHRGSITPPLTQSPTTTGGFGGVPGQTTAQPRREDSTGGRSMSSKNSTPNLNGSSKGSPSQYAMPSVGYSSTNNMHGFASTLPQMGGDNPFGDLFSPSLLKSASVDGNNFFGSTQQVTNHNSQNSFDSGNGGDSTAGLNRVFQFNGGSSASDSASPSASSSSQWNVNGAGSSCGTSPEPSHDSPANKTEKSVDNFCEKINPLRTYPDVSTLAEHQTSGNPNIGFTGNNIDYSVPSAGTFDPVLFGDYRDTSFGGTGNGDLSGGFFDEALNSGPYDFGSPSNLFGILQSPQQTNATLNANSGPANAPTPSRNLMAEIEKTREGGDDDYGLLSTQQKTTEGSGKLISCNNIWNQLQSNPNFQDGTFDLDSLCSELRAKARCSESGVVVDQDHVEKAIKKLGKKDQTSGKFVPSSQPAPEMPSLMFEQDSWDNVLKKLGGNGQF